MSLLPKPLYRDPCNGCGLCCIMGQCPLSSRFFGPRDLCPALEAVEGGAYTCGLIRDPARYSPQMRQFEPNDLRETYALILGAGKGCDCTHSDEDARRHEERPISSRAEAEASVQAARPQVRTIIRYMQNRP